MPAKFKPSHKEMIKGQDGRPTKRWRMKHYYLKQTPTQEIIEAINKGKRKHRNKFTKIEDVIRDEESKLSKQKGILSKEVYAQKIKDLNKKVNELKSKQASEAQKFERQFEKSTNKIQGALIDVLSMIANKNKLDVVMAKNQLLLVGRDIDLTEDAVKELNKILPKITKD